MKNPQRITTMLPAETYRRVKIAAAIRGMSVKDTLTWLLEQQLDALDDETMEASK